jgi:hypothetical protein
MRLHLKENSVDQYVEYSVQDLCFVTLILIRMISNFILYGKFPQIEVLPYGKTDRHHETEALYRVLVGTIPTYSFPSVRRCRFLSGLASINEMCAIDETGVNVTSTDSLR